ncbi:carbohydrate kinase [Frigidibacter sp.]|uniref:carbohydrate kinase family protein n=1 Tax=Frigidibacter sp. TaxID=2586418 RepID=UPI002732A1F8|nr:carbohydrate kinase [Frigidibacter sp.]MDP3340684.1 carbohydrate kinase [Frigidibacter sp.]
MILSCGEALIDMLPRTSAAGEPAFAPYPGGAVFNTAIALGRLGAPAGFLSGLSTDLFGQMLEASLAASGVDTSLAIRSDLPTTLAFVRLVNGQASYAFYDENTAGRMLTAEEMPALPDAVTAIFCGGISLMVEPGGAAYEALFLREAPARVAMIDPNIRPSFISDEPAYRARIARMIAAADIVKLSDEDLRWLAGPGEIPALAAWLLEAGPKAVFVTEGAAGAHAFTADQAIFAPGLKVTVADTVGAGDTFNAGILAALHQAGALTKAGVAALGADTLRAALDLGNRAAAVTVSRAGANPPFADELPRAAG